MICMALVIGIIDALYCLTVNADGLAGMKHGALEGILPLLNKTLTAGIITVTGMLAPHHNIPFAAQTILVVGTILYTAF